MSQDAKSMEEGQDATSGVVVEIGGSAAPDKMCLYDKLFGNLPTPARWCVNFLLLFTLLYMFLLGLDLMGNAFKGMSGKGVGGMLTIVDNPLAGLAIGVLATVLLQSSSTTTSIVVTMVSADIVTVTNAVPMIMGANIGTSVTNTMVAHGHINDPVEFTRGFQGATVHDAFNLLTVLIFLPLEIVTGAIGGDGGFLQWLSGGISDALIGSSAGTFTSPVKIIVGPLSKIFISINKDLIKGIAKGCIACTDAVTGATDFCKDDSRKDKAGDKIKECVSQADWTEIYDKGRIVKGGIAKGMGDAGGSAVVLILSLILLCLALYGIVRLLHHLVLSSGRASGEEGETDTPFVRITRKVLGFNPYLSIFFGAIMTICVQSSSIITSALTPLVALGIITVEQMLPLTLGANIGTTCTAFLASLVTEKKTAIQIALVHLFFNICGICVWFPVPAMRRVPIKISEIMAKNTVKFRWFGVYYIFVGFVITPLLLLAFSFTIALGPGGVILNVVLDLLTLGALFVAVLKFEYVDNFMQRFQTEQKVAVTDGKAIDKVDLANLEEMVKLCVDNAIKENPRINAIGSDFGRLVGAVERIERKLDN